MKKIIAILSLSNICDNMAAITTNKENVSLFNKNRINTEHHLGVLPILNLLYLYHHPDSSRHQYQYEFLYVSPFRFSL